MNEQTQALINRVAPLIDAVDLRKDFTPELQGAVNSVSASGAVIPNLVVKLLILEKRKEIDADQYLELVMLQPELTAALVKPDSMMSWMPLDEITFHQFSPVDNERFRAALAKIRGE